jgi:hypothetical protein
VVRPTPAMAAILLCGFAGVSGAHLRAHDRASPDDLSRFGAHGPGITATPAVAGNPTRNRCPERPNAPTARSSGGGSLIGSLGLENAAGAAHIPQMTQNTRSKLLEVVVVNRSSNSWEWQVWAGDEILVAGFESTLIAARLAGNDARFLSLAEGRK